MGRLREFGWAIRDRAGGIALVLALLGCGAGVAGIVIALDAKDKAEEEGSLLAAPANPTTDPLETGGSDVEATVEELNQRVAAIEESVAQLREEIDTGATTPEDTPTSGGSTTPETPELPEGIDIPGVGQPETEKPPAP